jgi:hypothetical protein
MAVYRIEAPDPNINGDVRGVWITDGVGYIPESPGAIGYFTRSGWTITALAEDDPQQPTLTQGT